MRALRFLAGVMAALVLLELLCRALPVSTATHTAYHFAPDIITYPAHHSFTLSSGWDLKNAQHLRSNNAGFLDSRDFTHDPSAIAVIGDSFVEANMLPEADRLSRQLERELAQTPVYAMGGPGSSLFDYLARARFAQERFGIRTFLIVVERSDVRQTLCGSGNTHGPCLDVTTLQPGNDRQAPAGKLKALARESALAQYFFSQLRIKPEALGAQLFPPRNPQAPHQTSVPPEDQIDDKAADEIIHRFFAGLAAMPDTRFVLVLDSDREAIHAGRTPSSRVLTRFKAAAATAGVPIVDTAPLFAAHYKASPLRLEVGPYDKHWNPLAMGIVARASAPLFASPAK
ncbi:hypothetical protein [Viridibacterium curvum]|uniref:AlgX/AlgJ SGNH hydrolase-like domain-containing protein n=1 Tax=Viridibacterium curvum TaxID=1101404 RepID=A0ABP9QF07_9RHOO